MNTSVTKAYLSALLYSVIIGLSFMLAKVTLQFSEPLDILTHRLFASFAGVLFLVLTKTVEIDLHPRKILRLLPVALFHPIMFFGFQIFGLIHSSSSEGGIIQASAPVFIMIFAGIFLREKLERRQMFSVLLSVVGVLYIVVKSGSNIELSNPLGVFLLLCSVLAFAGYVVLTRRLVQEFSPQEITFISQIFGFIVVGLFAVGNHLKQGDLGGLILPFKHPRYIISILYLGVLSTLGTASLYSYALSRLEAFKVSVFGNLGTVISMAVGVIFLHEQLFYYHIFGSILIIIGVVGANLATKKTVAISS